ncbi:TetR/AcrR family transcriptional regulator, partial [Nonomuraea sp. KC401]
PGFGRVLEMMLAAPTLTARLEGLGRRMTDTLAAALAEETGAADDDPLPRVMAWHIGSLHALVMNDIARRTTAGQPPEVIAERVLELLDTVESVLGERVLSYAVREDRPCSG